MISIKMFVSKTFYYFLWPIYLVSPRVAEKIKFRVKTRSTLNLKKPESFTEKLAVINILDVNRRKLKSICSDKYLVRSYVEKKGMGKLLNILYFKHECFRDINFSLLPKDFVIKSTYGSGYNVIVKDKKDLNLEGSKKILNKGLRDRSLFRMGELHYNHRSNVLIVEKYIYFDDKDPVDYKVYCFNGEPRVILAIVGRSTGEVVKNFYDFEWNVLDKYLNGSGHSFKKPNNLIDMYQSSKRLSEDFLFVRVDFYDTAEGLILGEMTFTPAGNYSQSHNTYAERVFGKWLNIEEIL